MHISTLVIRLALVWVHALHLHPSELHRSCTNQSTNRQRCRETVESCPCSKILMKSASRGIFEESHLAPKCCFVTLVKDLGSGAQSCVSHINSQRCHISRCIETLLENLSHWMLPTHQQGYNLHGRNSRNGLTDVRKRSDLIENLLEHPNTNQEGSHCFCTQDGGDDVCTVWVDALPWHPASAY